MSMTVAEDTLRLKGGHGAGGRLSRGRTLLWSVWTPLHRTSRFDLISASFQCLEWDESHLTFRGFTPLLRGWNLRNRGSHTHPTPLPSGRLLFQDSKVFAHLVFP